MMSFDPNLRPTLEEVLCHPWMMGETPTQDEIRESFTERRNIVKAHEHQERMERRQKKIAKAKTTEISHQTSFFQ